MAHDQQRVVIRANSLGLMTYVFREVVVKPVGGRMNVDYLLDAFVTNIFHHFQLVLIRRHVADSPDFLSAYEYTSLSRCFWENLE